MRNFEKWLLTFRNSISDYKYYVDFNKVYNNVNDIKIELNILNSLIGSQNIEDDFEKIVTKYPEVLKCIPILIAKREKEIYCTDYKGSYNYNFNSMNYSVEQYKYFMRETGLFELISTRLTNNLVDYVMGIETGLDSNGRKNRGGHLMENLVEDYIVKAGFVKDVNYFKEIQLSEVEKMSSLDLSTLSNNGKVVKRFDYVIINNGITYAIECNFYASTGSKLYETARSYKTLALESKQIKNFKFVWFTDGTGWISAKNNLKETFDVLDMLFNIKDLEDGVINKF